MTSAASCACPAVQTLVEDTTRSKDSWTLNADLPYLKEFMPGGSRAAALTHVARTVCRRAERRIVSLSRVEDVPQTSVEYINRLSDLLFVMARVLNKHAGMPDVLWQPGKTQKDK